MLKTTFGTAFHSQIINVCTGMSFFLHCFRKSCAEISCFLHSFWNPFLFKNLGWIGKSCLHESFRSQKILQLLCFAQNLVRNLIPSFSPLNSPGRAWNLGTVRLGFLSKLRPLEPYFGKRSLMSPRKNRSLQLSCFKFYQIQPLRASKSVFQKTGQFPELAVFLF